MKPRPTLAIVATIVWGALLIPGLAGAALSPMFFDAPGSMDNPVAYFNVLIVLSFPCLCLLSIAGVWFVYFRQTHGPTRALSYAQISIAALPLLPIAYVAAALAIGIISVLASGEPMGLHSTVIQP